MSACRRKEMDPYLLPCTKLKSKWIKDIIINPNTVSPLAEKVENNLERIDTEDIFLNTGTKLDK